MSAKYSRILIVAIWSFIYPGTSLADNHTLTGQASVVDGDTIEIHGQRIRLHGIDAPESNQKCRDESGSDWRCGKEAAFALDNYIASKTVSCDYLSTDRYKRMIGRCRVAGQDIQAWMVRNGWAMAYRKYSTDYVREEIEARENNEGVWRGEFVPPWRWRRGERLSRVLLDPPEKLIATEPGLFKARAQGCCKYCRKGKACGDSCIRREYSCRKSPGCACNDH